MSHKEFLALTEDEQYWVLNYNSVRVASCIQGMYKYVLFQIGSFYLEIKVDRKSDETLQLISFSGTEGLDKYLKRVPLPPHF